jgi:hypothetical protein
MSEACFSNTKIDALTVFQDVKANGTIGDGGRIVTIKTNKWPIVFFTFERILQIGCKQYPLEEWLAFSYYDINNMDIGATDFWRIWKPIVTLMFEGTSKFT